MVMRMDIDVGSLISHQISQMGQPNSSRLGFPALVIALCIARGVIFDSLTFESLSHAINLAYIKKNCWNLDDPTIIFPGTRKSRARGPDSIVPFSSTPVDPASTSTPAPSTSAAFYPFAMMLTNNINLQRKPMPQQENTRMEKVMRGDTRMTNLLRRVELLSLFFFPFFFCLPSRIQ